MARTRLRGISIGGIQIGIEVPEIFDWEWPESPVAEFQCLPRDPEVHVGLRIGDPGAADLNVYKQRPPSNNRPAAVRNIIEQKKSFSKIRK